MRPSGPAPSVYDLIVGRKREVAMVIDYTLSFNRAITSRPSVASAAVFLRRGGRREFICGGGASVLSVILATLLAGSKPVRAEAVTGSAPELDRVAVRTVIDSYQFAVAPSRKLPNLDVQHFGWVSATSRRAKRWSANSALRCMLRVATRQRDAQYPG